MLRRRPRLWGTAIAVEHREEDEEAVAAADIISPSVSLAAIPRIRQLGGTVEEEQIVFPSVGPFLKLFLISWTEASKK